VANADVAWVDVLPSARRFLPELERSTTPAAQRAGKTAGDQFGRSFGTSATNGVEAASRQMTAAMRKVQDAAGKVRVEEQRLLELRQSGRATSSQLIASEERLATARRRETDANAELARSTTRVRTAQEQHAVAVQSSSRAMDEGNRRAGVLTRTFGGMRGAVTAGFAAFYAAKTAIDFLGSAIEAASDLGEQTSKVSVVFGDANKRVLAFAGTTSQSLGISRREALTTAGTFGNLFRAIGLTTDTSADMSIQLVRTAADLASFNNASPQEVLEAMRAGLVGETEPLRRFGINISDAAMRAELLAEGIELQSGPLTAAQKAQAAYQLILKQTTLAQGDFERTSGSLANQQRILSATWDDQKAKLGALLVGPMTTLVHWGTTTFIPAVGHAFEAVRQAISAFTAAWKYNDGEVTSSGFNGYMERVGYIARQVWDALKVGAGVLAQFGGWVLKNVEWLGPLVGIITAIVAASRIWVGVQILLNTAIAANPIGFILSAVRLLVIALATAWATSETFRNVVTAVFRAVGDAAVWLWEHAIKPAWAAIQVAWDALVTAAQWAWQRVLQPTWRAIADAAGWLWTTVLQPTFHGIQVAWDALVTGIRWAWERILQPVWNVIQTAATVLYRILVVIVFGAIMLAWRELSQNAKATWDHVLKPVWDAVAATAQWLWEHALKPAFQGIQVAWTAVLDTMKWAWEHVLKPAWDTLSTAAHWLWTNILKPIFGAIGDAWDGLMNGMRAVYDNVIHPMWTILKKAIDSVKGAFETVVEAIRKAWDGLMYILATPINFVIEIIFNKGLFTAWNWVVRNLGLPSSWSAPHWSQIPEGKQFADGGQPRDAFAGGGKIPGPYHGPTADNVMASVPGYGPIRVNPREWIHPVASVDYYGDEFMRAIQNRAIPREALYGFAGGGPVWETLWSIVHSQFPWARLTSAYRPGASDYHGAGKAVDVAGTQPYPWGTSIAQMAQMNQWIAGKYPQSTELIHSGPGSINLWHGQPHTYDAATQAQHFNHVHWAMEALSTLASSGNATWYGGTPETWWSGVWSSVTGAFNWFKDKISAVGEMVSRFGNNPFVGMVKSIPGNLLGKLWGTVKDKISALFLTGQDLQSGDVQGAFNIAKGLMNNFGWSPDGNEWVALRALWHGESGWNPRAENPTSTASGIPQFIDGTWNAYKGIGVTATHAASATAYEQIAAGLRYISEVYGSPSRAYMLWSSRAPHWYSGGGQVPVFHNGGTTAGWRSDGLALMGPDERVLRPQEDDYFRRFVDAVSGQGASVGKRQIAEQMTIVQSPGESTDAFVDRLWHKVRVADRGGVYVGDRS
jgi:hypothetical protein